MSRASCASSTALSAFLSSFFWAFAFAAARECRRNLLLHLGLRHQVYLLLDRQERRLVGLKLFLGGFRALQHAQCTGLVARMHELLGLGALGRRAQLELLDA